MKTKTMSKAVSSLQTAAFRLCLVRTSRGLVYRLRREIKTMRRLHADAYPDVLKSARCGRLRSSADISHLRSIPSLM